MDLKANCISLMMMSDKRSKLKRETLLFLITLINIHIARSYHVYMITVFLRFVDDVLIVQFVSNGC